MKQDKKSSNKLALSIILLVASMVIFASVPLYNLFYKVTGYGEETKHAMHSSNIVSTKLLNIHPDANVDSKSVMDSPEETLKIDINKKSNITFKEALDKMSLLLNEVIELNSFLTAGKVTNIVNFKELSTKKLDVLNKLKKIYLDLSRKYLLNSSDFKNLENKLNQEIFNTFDSINDKEFIPYLPEVFQYEGVRKSKRSQKDIDNEIDNINEKIGGQVFLKRIDYIKRSNNINIPSTRILTICGGKCCYGTTIQEEEID